MITSDSNVCQSRVSEIFLTQTRNAESLKLWGQSKMTRIAVQIKDFPLEPSLYPYNLEPFHLPYCQQ
jgi:hypothetical protein